jgi:hypothetical protein
MTITIWPHGWSLQTLLLLVAVFWFAVSAGAAAGTWNLQDAAAVSIHHGQHHHPQHTKHQWEATP